MTFIQVVVFKVWLCSRGGDCGSVHVVFRWRCLGVGELVVVFSC